MAVFGNRCGIADVRFVIFVLAGPIDCGERDLRRRKNKPDGYLRFKDCGFRDRVTRGLLAGGIDTPEQLLSMTPDQIRLIQGIGSTLMNEIERYRARFQ